MNQKNSERKELNSRRHYIPEEIRIKYFPPDSNIPTYDILPLFELENYEEKIQHQVSIIENPHYAKKWESFVQQLPDSAKQLRPVHFNQNTIPIFSKYRRRKVPPEYFQAFIHKPMPEAIFRKTK